jgi:hypothetical protein
MGKLRNGHAPGHVRETACAAFEEWLDWDGRSPLPTVDYEVKYKPQRISLARACGLVRNCTDIVPGMIADPLITEGLPAKSRTYGAIARAILDDLKAHAAV